MKYLLPSAMAVVGLFSQPGAFAATFTVTNPAPSSSTGTFLWALEQASLNAGPDTIRFSVGSGPVTVELPNSQTVAHTVTIDGTSQPGYMGTPIVSIRTASINPSYVLTLNGIGSQVRGLAFIDDTLQGGVRLGGDNCVVDNCWFGLNHNRAPYRGYRGIDVGTTLLNPSFVTIKNCVIGNQRGVGIRAQNASNLSIMDCGIGTDLTADPVYSITNSGIELIDCDGAFIGAEVGGEGCIIRNCGGDGVSLLNSADTVIIGNRIFHVGQMAIDHGMDDDPGIHNLYRDADIATGGSQNLPFIDEVTKSDGSIRIKGDFNSSVSTQFLLEFYASTGRGMFRRGEGQYRLGVSLVTSDSNGDVAFDEAFVDTLPGLFPLYFSMTATRFDQSWGTSEFSPQNLPVYAGVVADANPGADPQWVPSGIDSGPEHTLDPASVDDVDVERNFNELRVVVRPSSGRFRVAGWTHRSLTTMVEDGATIFRGKFYIYASNPAGAPLNTVPNFRIRLENEGVVAASNTYEYATTGNSAVPHEPYYGSINFPDIETRSGASLRPTDSSSNPSLYRLDFVPVVVPASGGSRISATFESYAGPDPANGVLALTEIQLSSYSAFAGSAVAFTYSDDPDFHFNMGYADPGIPTTTGSGGFNIEADFQPGRRQALDLPGEVSTGELANVTGTMGVRGIVLDTLNVPDHKIGVGIFNMEAANNVTAPRLLPDTSYIALFVASSDMPAEPSVPAEAVQGSMFFQVQTGGGAVTSRLELIGPAAFAGPPGNVARTIAAQTLPGKNSQNLLLNNYPMPAGEKGGAYLVVLPPVLSQDIRRTTPGNLGPLADEPGPGVNAPSYRDIKLGVIAIKQPSSMRLSPDLVVPWAPPNRARVRLLGVVLLQLAPIDDGGYL